MTCRVHEYPGGDREQAGAFPFEPFRVYLLVSAESRSECGHFASVNALYENFSIFLVPLLKDYVPTWNNF